MESKNILVSFLAVVSILLLAVNVSASNIARNSGIEVEGVDAYANTVSVIAGDVATVKVVFTADKSDRDVTVEAEIEGDKIKTSASTKPFDVEENKTYTKTLDIKVPYELKDDLSNDVVLTITIDGKEYKTTLNEITLRVQRPSYNAAIKSATVSNSANAGETIPIDLVIKNLGYNDLNDVYVTAKISALNVGKTSYFGDLVAQEECNNDCNEDEKDTVSGRLFLEIPYNVEPGVYTLEIEVKNDDSVNTVVKQISIKNDFTNSVIASTSKKTVAVGENAEYTLLVVNPTNKLKVYRVITESSDAISSNAEESVIVVQAESSKAVKVTAKASSEGEYDFNVNVLSGEELVGTAKLTASVEGSSNTGKSLTNPVVVLTVILAIVFLVLLVVLIVLIGKKPEKSELGESYY